MANKVEIIINADGTRAIKSLQEVGATARATGTAAKQASEAAAIASKFEGDTVSAQSVKIIQARQKEREAAADYAKIQSLTRKGAIDETAGVTTTAAAYQKLAEAKKRVAELDRVIPPPPKVTPPPTLANVQQSLARREEQQALNPHDFLRERLNERVGEFGITESMTGLTAAIAGVGVVAGEAAEKLREMVTETLEMGEQMQRASAKTGLSVETLSTLRFAAKLTGGDFESMTKAVAKMGASLGEAADGGNKKAAAAFKALGLDAKELANQADGTEIAFKRVAQAMAATESASRRNELAKSVLSKAGIEEVATLRELGENWDQFRAKAEQAGVVMSGAAADALARMNQRLKELKETGTGAGIALTEGLLPALTSIAGTLTGSKDAFDGFRVIGEGIGRAFEFAAAQLYSAASGAALLASLAAGGGLTSVGRYLETKSENAQTKADKLYYEAATGKPAEPAGDPVLKLMDAIKERNASRAGLGEGFGGMDLGGADKAAQKRLKGMEAELAVQKLQFGVTLTSEYQFWDARKNVFAVGSDQYNTIVEKQASLAEQGARSAHERIAKFQAEELRQLRSGADEKMKVLQASARADWMHAKDRYEGQEEQRKGVERVYSEQQDGQDRMREFRLSLGTAGDAARGMAAIHQAQAQRDMESLVTDRQTTMQNPYLDEQQRQRQLAAIDEQIERVKQSTELQAAEDEKRIESTTLMGGMNDALRQFVQEATNAGAQMRQLFGSSVNSTNDAILKYLTEPSSQTRGQHIFGQAGHEIFSNIASAGLKGAEGSLLKALGLGGVGKKDGSTEGAALWVRMAGAGSGSGVPKIPGMTDGMGTLSDVLSLGLPGMPENKGGAGSDGSSGFAGLLSKLFGGGGGKKGDGSSPSSPLYVKDVGGAGGGSTGDLTSLFGGGGGDSGGSSSDSGSGFGSFLSSLFGGGSSGGGGDSSSGGGGIFSSLIGALIPGFAEGTDFAPGGMALVGEEGPELVNLPRGSSVTPNKMLGAGEGGGDHHFHFAPGAIDARGAHDPAAVDAAVQRGIRAAAPHIVSASVAANRDMRNRMPSAAR